MKLYVVCLGAILGWSSAHVMVQAQDAPIPPTPEIFGFWPTNGSPGTFVTIQGTNFFNVQSVQINGVNASVFNFTLDPGPPVRGYVRVPEGATTGPITVVTLAGTAKSADDFVVQEAPAPVITGLGSPSGSVGDSVVITGSNFVDVVSVKFNGVDGLWESASMEAINADVPEGATTGLIEVITKHGQAFSPAPFIIVPKDQTPIIQDFSPVQGPAGTSVLFNGDNFDGITAVLFNGVSAQFTAMFSRAFFAKVPSGATTGPITVQTQHGTFTTSNSFTVTSLPAPVIQQISPSQAAIGAIVQITGFNLDQVQSVLFNGSPASFSHFGGLWVTVPTNATTGPITVISPAGSATSSQVFTPLATGDLLLTQTISTALATTGQDVSYTLVVTNRGPSAVGGIQVTNVIVVGDKWTLPALFFDLGDSEPSTVELPSLGETNAFAVQSVSSSQGTAVVTNNTVRCDLGALKVGESATVSFTVRALQVGRLNHLAVVRTTDTDSDLRSNFSLTSTRVVAPDELLIQLVRPAGFELSWSADVTNAVIQTRTLSGSWLNVSESPSLQDGRVILKQPITDTPQLYRLQLSP